ncbi:unnamed protein product [Anisakis simplex]|uniref:Pep_M12B_propep domain-containing protein n=1 Tax=Anisakis simplex TaxID=6269 RepID=A0A158PPL8_ANISI|nr:unnamed protein product [Anisakis simplex]
MPFSLSMFTAVIISFSIFALPRAFALKGEIRHLSTNKEFISRLDEGQFEVVHPFQVRDKNERIGIDTSIPNFRNYFLNGTVHYKQVTIVIRSNVIGRLKLLLSLNELIFVNGTEFMKLDSRGESSVSKRIENCYYQGTVNGEESSFVALSTCNGLRYGYFGFVDSIVSNNGTSFGLWPLDGGDRGRRHPHVLYRIKWSIDALCNTQSTLETRHSRKAPMKRDVTRQTKYVELAIIGDHSFMKMHDLIEDVGIEYMLEAINIADFVRFHSVLSTALSFEKLAVSAADLINPSSQSFQMFNRDLNVRLSVVYSEEWIDAQRIDVYQVIERTLSGVIEYVTGHIYHIG